MSDLQKVFSDSFEKHSDELFRHAYLRVGDRERALDITHECFLRSWRYVCEGHEIQEMRPFLYRTLRNLIIDEYRLKKWYSLEAMTDDEEGITIDSLLPPDESNTIEAAMDRFDGKRALAALQKLPDLYREVLTLRYVDDLSPQEIAKVLGIGDNATSVRIHRGISRLREVLAKEEGMALAHSI